MNKWMLIVASILLAQGCGGGSSNSETTAIEASDSTQQSEQTDESDEANSDEETPSGEFITQPIVEAEVDDVSDTLATKYSITGFTAEDDQGIEVIAYIGDSYSSDDITIAMGGELELHESNELVSNGFTKITYAEDDDYLKIVRIKTSQEFNAILVKSKYGRLGVTPFRENDDGTFEFRAEAVDGEVIFALVNRPQEGLCTSI